MLAGDDRAMPFLAPDPAQKGFEADAMLVLAPDLDRRLGVIGLDLGYCVGENLFF
jgi:hypothetical protein